MIERIDHINLVVDDMQTTIGFYCELLGMRVTKQATIGGPWIDAMTGLSGVEADVAFLELPEGPGIELLHYRKPQGTRPEGLARPNTKGLRHFALRVQNLDELAARMKAAGARLASEVQEVPAAQVDYADLRKRLLDRYDPEGNLLELCSYQSSGSTAGVALGRGSKV